MGFLGRIPGHGRVLGGLFLKSLAGLIFQDEGWIFGSGCLGVWVSGFWFGDRWVRKGGGIVF